jgi:hypothetical protein
MIFKIYDCDFGIKYNGVNYDFEHVNELTIEDPENTKLTRGANSANKSGLVYREGMKEPKRWTVTIMNMSSELKGVLDAVYEQRARLDAYCISRVDGSSKMAKDAILCQQPQQLSIVDGPDSMNVQLIFETFDSSEVHKS